MAGIGAEIGTVDMRRTQKVGAVDRAEFDAELSSVNARLTVRNELMSFAEGDALSGELGRLALATAGLDPPFLRLPKILAIERLADILTIRCGEVTYYGEAFKGLVQGGIRRALLPENGLGEEQIESFLRYTTRIRDHLVYQANLSSTVRSQPEFDGTYRMTINSKVHLPDLVASAIQELGDAIPSLVRCQRSHCYRPLVSLADCLVEDHPHLYVQTMVRLSKVRGTLPLRDSLEFRDQLESMVEPLKSRGIGSSSRLREATEVSPLRNLRERVAARTSRRAL